MKSFFLRIVLNPIQRVLAIGIGALILLIAFILFHPGPKPVVTHPLDNVTVVTIPSDVLTPKDVIKFVVDDAEVKRLLADNKKLKIQVTQLTEVIANRTSTGQGPVIQVPVASIPEPLRPIPIDATLPPTDTAFEFTDWRLHFVSLGNQARYALTQKFEVLSTTGKGKDGKPVATTRLFEIGPGETRTEVTDTKTTNVFANDARAKWHLGFTLQAGVGYVVRSEDTTKKAPAPVIGVQWLKKGTTEVAEDSTLSLLTPVATYSFDEVEFGVLPVSFNLGRIKYQPLKDLWVSPYLGWNAEKKSLGRVGIVVTASF